MPSLGEFGGLASRSFRGLGLRVWGLGSRVWGLGLRVWGLGFEMFVARVEVDVAFQMHLNPKP